MFIIINNTQRENVVFRTPGNHFKVCAVVALYVVFLYQAGKSFLLIFMLTEVITVSKLAFVPLVFHNFSLQLLVLL
jgi:hypothetical protein